MPVCSSVTRIETGIVTRPMQMNSTGRFRYMRHVAVTVWPHERRRPRRSGVLGVHVVREQSQPMRIASAARTPSVSTALFASRLTRFDPVSTAPQNEPVAAVPSAPPAGIP